MSVCAVVPPRPEITPAPPRRRPRPRPRDGPGLDSAILVVLRRYRRGMTAGELSVYGYLRASAASRNESLRRLVQGGQVVSRERPNPRPGLVKVFREYSLAAARGGATR
jgi:hypothetical protein